MIKNYNKFLTKMKNLKLYIIKLLENSTKKYKIYLFNYIIKSKNC